MRVVLDTNVLVSAAISPHGRASQLLHFAAEGEFSLFLSPFILHEVKYVLFRIGFEPDKIKKVLEALEDITEIVEPKTSLKVITADPADNHILECAVEAKAHVLVTGDIKHIRPLGIFQGISILTPAEFFQQYFPKP